MDYVGYQNLVPVPERGQCDAEEYGTRLILVYLEVGFVDLVRPVGHSLGEGHRQVQCLHEVALVLQYYL